LGSFADVPHDEELELGAVALESIFGGSPSLLRNRVVGAKPARASIGTAAAKAGASAASKTKSASRMSSGSSRPSRAQPSSMPPHTV
jgi:hypothetical protein